MDDKNNIYITNISSEQKKNVNHPKLSPIDLNSLIVPKHTTIECEHSITFPSITSVTSRNRTTSFREKVYKNTEPLPVDPIHYSLQATNFSNYKVSCNKYNQTLSKLIKLNFEPKRIIQHERKYDIKENKMISTLERNEMFNRSPGQGMFARLQRYKEMNRRIPFKIINTDLLTAGRVKPKTISKTKRIILGRIKA